MTTPNARRRIEEDDNPHPLIVQAADIMEGHAHLKGTRIKVETILRTLASEPPTPPTRLMTMSARSISATDMAAALHYAADIMKHLHQLYAELNKLKFGTPERKP